MSEESFEKERDDEVYEDDFFEKDEELGDEDDEDLLDEKDEKDEDDDDSEPIEKKIHVSFACEDCDYRWDDIIVKSGNNLEDEEEDFDGICPMCGSSTVSQI